MKVCFKCKKEKNSDICTECITKTLDAQRCPNKECGIYLMVDAKFCTECGSQVKKNDSGRPPEITQPVGEKSLEATDTDVDDFNDGPLWKPRQDVENFKDMIIYDRTNPPLSDRNTVDTLASQRLSHESNTSLTLSQHEIAVQFRVLLSPDIKFEKDSDNVHIVFFKNDVSLQRCKMTTVLKSRDRNYLEFTFERNVRKNDVSNGVFCYQYHVERNSLSDKTHEKRTDIAELLYGNSSEYQKRVLEITDMEAGKWLQFDGFIYRRDSNFKKFQQWCLGTKDKDAEKTIEIFGHDIAEAFNKSSQLSLTCVMKQMSQLLFCIERIYNYDKCSKTKKKVRTELWNVCIHYTDDNHRNEKRLSFLLLIIMISKDYFIDVQAENMALICERLGKIKAEESFFQNVLIDGLTKDQKSAHLDYILKFASAVQKEKKEYRWFFLLPYIHILSGLCDPNADVRKDLSYDTDQWWGFNDNRLKKIVDIFREKEDAYFEQNMISNIYSLFGFDFLLPRTMLVSFQLAELKEAIKTKQYPIYACLASIITRMKNLQLQKDKKVIIGECLEELLKNINAVKDKGYPKEKDNATLLATIIASNLVVESTQGYARNIVCCSWKIFLFCLSSSYTMINKSSDETQDDWFASLKDTSCKIKNWMNKQTFQLEEEILTWNELFLPQDMASIEHMNWDEDLIDAASRSLKRRAESGECWKMITLLCKHESKYEVQMRTIMSTAIECAVPTDQHCVDTNGWKETERNVLQKLFEKIFMDYHRSLCEAYTEMKIHAILSWGTLPTLIKVLDGDEKMHISGTESICGRQMNGIRLILKCKIESLQKGKIPLDELKVMEENESLFLNLVEKTNPEKAVDARTALGARLSEYHQMEIQLASLFELKRLCAYLKSVDTSPIDEIIDKKNNGCALSDIVNIKTETEEDQLENLIALKPLQDLVSFVDYYKGNQLFLLWWTDECKQEIERSSEHVYSIEDVNERIMLPVKKRLDKLASDIKTGNMTFHDMENLFETQFGSNYNAMHNEMYTICLDEEAVSKRIEQLKQFRNQEDITKIAHVILDLRNVYQIEGNFDILNRLQTHEFYNLAMNKYEISLSEIGNLFTDVTQEQISCLKVFVDCVELVKWLRVSMSTSGLKEFLVFVDLAMISAGEDVENIAKVQSLHAGVTGYSSLIFDLEQNDDCYKVVQKCRDVWVCLKETPMIPQKLLYANNYLQWFKTVQKRHGEVEKTSFMQAKAIIDSGVFTIGKQETSADVKTNKVTNLSNVIKLTVPADNTNESIEYNIHQLEDLQSKLMLVAGEAREGHESVERFIAILDGVTRLSVVYIRLVTSGCVLFEKFAIEIFCEPNLETPVCAILKFKNGEDLTQFKCRKTADEKLEDILPKLSEGMEICLKEWIEFVDENRQKHEHLNYFTMNQLVILQREIAKLYENKTMSDNVFPLLAYVKADCNKDDIVEAYERVVWEMKTKVTEHNEEHNGSILESEKDKERSDFIATLRDMFSDTLVQEALKKFPNYNTADAIFWCMKNKLKDEENSQKMESQTEISEESQEIETVEQYLESEIDDGRDFDHFKEMLTKFNRVWTKFIKSIVSNLKDFISLQELGTLLLHLSLKGVTDYQRRMPDLYKETQPNLVICPTDQILITTMSVYMEAKDVTLPKADEVLMCTSQTTLEQVDIFLIRAVFFSRGKIHCLVNADNLDFYVCEGVQTKLQEYIRNVENKVYRLVIICGSENEHTSSIISSLEKYRTQPLILDISTVSSVISNNLKVKSKADVAAASVDFDRSTVRVVRSWRSGVGKTLYKKRREQELQERMKTKKVLSFSIPLHEQRICHDYVVGRLLEQTQKPGYNNPRLFHIDVTNEVEKGVDYLLFNLLILGCLTHSSGYVWRKSPNDLYLVETLVKRIGNEKVEAFHSRHQVLELLPCVTCRSPRECESCKHSTHDQLFDEKLKNSDLYQKPYKYLQRMSYKQPDCLSTMLKFCPVPDPSWSELTHLVSFLQIQLDDFENNVFLAGEGKRHFPGFDNFALKFLLKMSKEFSSRSLKMSEEFEDMNSVEAHAIEHTWESRHHPYLLFNADHQTLTFIGFSIDQNTLNSIDSHTKRVLEEKVISKELFYALKGNGVPLTETFDELKRNDKIKRLCSVMGITFTKDPDATYELTTDNVTKMMAIYMRFRSDIPVIVMGETGCGKTRLVKFMCDLMLSDEKISRKKPVQNMIILKVHGGTKNHDIISSVENARIIAHENFKTFGEQMYTVLFFDEANTTESIGLIKEIMCDKTMEGRPLRVCNQLKIVAACNPYRRHPKELIEKLEKAGLGYHVKANETSDRLGKVPLRRLVYRVRPLPQSLIPFVWDFGQLTDDVEALYIRQMVNRYMGKDYLPRNESVLNVLSNVFTACQRYMRNLKDECSFVSLRDVERVLKVTSWFYKGSARRLFSAADDIIRKKHPSKVKQISQLTRALVLAIGVCYNASLSDRRKFRTEIAKCFEEPCTLTRGPEQIQEEIESFQDAVLNAVALESDIAKNMALKENVFMMVICTELRIPLFLVGKPGSSKSLARLAITNAMQGNAAGNDLFKELKQVQMLTFQCSPHSTPEGIATTFHQCARFQENNNPDKFVSVVVLEEIGLAEDSPKLPLKILHPLLEDGCENDEKATKADRRVGFIGISNWALDPAKMNRGLFVQRPVPSTEELEQTAKGICKHSMTYAGMEELIKELSIGYLKVFEEATKTNREFFGLRDFYCLMKSINSFVKKFCRMPTMYQLRFAILRNFSGLENVQSVDIFIQSIISKGIIRYSEKPESDDPDVSFEGLINSCLSEGDSRHLLLLTENYSALSTFQQHFLEKKTDLKTVVIFGSSFKKDQVYTQVCRNINRIKNCMETGNTVILLNSENLYESLYEALNQNYVNLAGQRYVDLGLGTHRVKCPVHKNFKLIVVAEKTTVYETFPIPLINRLEKHNLTSSTMLKKEQADVSNQLRAWVDSLTKDASKTQFKERSCNTNIGEVIVGFHDDACSSVVLSIWDTIKQRDENDHKKEVLLASKRTLLWCTTPDAILRIALSYRDDMEWIQDTYWKMQTHESLTQYLKFKQEVMVTQRLLVQVTTHENLPTRVHKKHFSEASGIEEDQILLLESLTKFDTVQQFSNKIREFLQRAEDTPVLLILTCDTGNLNAHLIACAKYSAEDECKSAMVYREAMIHVVVIVQLPAVTTEYFKGIQCGQWHSVHIDHIDNLSRATSSLPTIPEMKGQSIAQLVKNASEIASKTTGDSERRNHINLQQIVAMCVQRAMTMVRDKGDNDFRTVHRISLLVKLLRINPDFARGVGLWLAYLLEEKARTSVPLYIENWLSHEAALTSTIRKSGTLRRACLQTFEKTLSPLLAGIISILDVNQNIKIMEESEKWRQTLWLDIFCQTETFSLTYKDIVTRSQDKSQVAFVVEATGFGGHTFESMMPFSWVLFKKIEEVLKNDSYMVLGEMEESVMRLENILEGVLITRAINAVNPDYREEAIDYYIQDFVHMIYKSPNENSRMEYKALCEVFKTELRNSLQMRSGKSLAYALTHIHQAHKTYKRKLQYFFEINKSWPETSVKIMQLDDKHFLKKNQTSDVVLKELYVLIESISGEDTDKLESKTNWLIGVHKMRNVVEQLFAFYDEEHIEGTEKHIFETARSMWNRVVILQLFIEALGKSSNEEQLTAEFCSPLWKMFKDEQVDLRQIETFVRVEEFLGLCYTRAKNLHERKKQKCSQCGKPITETGRKLPCSHEVCGRCVQLILSKSTEKHCPTCQESLNESYLKDENSVYRFISKKDLLADFQERWFMFFITVIPRLCFVENKGPSEKVVEKLMEYSLGSSVAETGVAPNHAFRSLIFQLLIRSSRELFQHNLDENGAFKQFLSNEGKGANTPDEHGSNQNSAELLLLLESRIEDNISESLSTQIDLLTEAKQLMLTKGSVFKQLEGIARCKINLANSAESVGHILMKKDTDPKWLLFAKDLCTTIGHDGPRLYILKYIYNQFGIDTLIAALSNDNPLMNWIGQEEMQIHLDNMVDMYVICGDAYIRFKEHLTQRANTTSNGDDLKAAKCTACVYMQLAMFRQYVLSVCKFTSEEMYTSISNVKKIFGLSENTEITNAIVRNNLKPFNVDIDRSESKDDISVKILVFQWMCILYNIKKEVSCNLLARLNDLIKCPEMYQDMYFPTMPHDDVYEIRQEILQQDWFGEVPTLYSCPNGHPYVIADCGRAWEKAKCVCGANIGGRQHKLDEGNTKFTRSDKTQTGHVLGKPRQQYISDTERDLKPSEHACMRLILHLSLYVSSRKKKYQSVSLLMKPKLNPEETVWFLKEHIKNDIASIQLRLSFNYNETLLFCHSLLQNILLTTANERSIHETKPLSWDSKENRRKWENDFNHKYLKPFIENSYTIVAEANELLKRKNDLVMMLSDNGSIEISPREYLCENKAFWMYRSPVNFMHMLKTFKTNVKNKKTYPVLNLFLEKEHVLKAVRLIPSILKLQLCIQHRLCAMSYKSDNQMKTVGKMKQEKIAGEETESIFKDAAEAWEIARSVMKDGKVIKYKGRLVGLYEEVCDKPFTDDSPIDVLLIDTEGEGICSFAMLDLLIDTHNEILDEYLKKLHVDVPEISLSKINLREMTSAHLICFDTKQDIRSLILANCSFNIRTDEVVYDFENMEKLLIDRFIATKSFVDKSDLPLMNQSITRTELTSTAALERLENKMPQECIPPAVRKQICSRMQDIPDICQILSSLDIVIRFLIVSDKESKCSLISFMKDTLKLGKCMIETEIQQLNCEHVKSLWLALSIQRASLMVNNKMTTKDIFDGVDEKYNEDIPVDFQTKFKTFLLTLSNPKLYVLLDVLFEFITMKVSKRADEDEDIVDDTNQKLKEWVIEYGEYLNKDLSFVSNGFPDDIKQMHCLHAWTTIASHMSLSEKP